MVISYFGMGFDGFRILAPETMQGTTLKENHCPDSRAVVDGKPLDIENQAGIGMVIFHLKA
jgi:hypothetical protein